MMREARGQMISEFKLPKSGGTAVIDILQPEHLPDVLALQDATREALPDDQKMFVLPQKPDYFEKFLTRKNGCMVGIRTDGTLIAQMAVMGSLTLEEAIERNACTRNHVPYHHAEMTDLICVAKSMAVHPQWRGNELSQHMLNTVLDMPSVRAVDHVFAQMSASNVRSWELFMQRGFGIVASAIDPIDHQSRFILQKPALDFELYPMPSIDDIHPVDDFSAILRLTDHEALVGQIDHGDATRLSFHATGTTAAAWTDEPAKLAR
jgi:N-acetylglutamate synthase-like GNAT family acetyltransferase